MKHEIHQQNGQNSRSAVIEDDRIVTLATLDGSDYKTVFPFDAGLVSQGYNQRVVHERLFASSWAPVWIGGTVALMFASIAMLSQTEQNTAWAGPGMLGLLTAVSSLLWVAAKTQPRKVTVYDVPVGTRGAYILFYGRDEHDRKHVNDFLDQAAEAQKHYFRKKFLHFNEAMGTEEKRARLSWLYEQQFISDHELDEHLKNLPK